MKQFKKLLLTSTLLLISYLGFSQTPTAQFRVALRTTDFGQNLPVGTQIYVVSDSTLWQAMEAIAAGEDVTSAKSANKLISLSRTAIYVVERYEIALAGIAVKTHDLGHVPIDDTDGVSVMMNGAALRPTTDYTTNGAVLTIEVTQMEYDQFVVSYTYFGQ